MRGDRRLLILLAPLLLGGCPGTTPTRTVVPKAEPVIVTRVVYVPVDGALTAPLPIAEGSLAECPRVASERRAALMACNARLDAIRGIEGTEQKPEDRTP